MSKTLWMRLKQAPHTGGPQWETVTTDGFEPVGDGIYRWHQVSAEMIKEYNAIMSDYGQLVGRLMAIYESDIQAYVTKRKPILHVPIRKKKE